MIRGFIDFNTLDSKQSFTSTTLESGVTLPGFQLEIDADKVRSFARGQQAVIIIGDPRSATRALHSESNRMAGAQRSPLCDAPDTFLKQVSGRFAFLWMDLAKGRLGLASDRFNTNGFCYAQEGLA
jgi:hypothetical protein